MHYTVPIYMHFYVPVTPSRVSTALARSCLIFRSALRSQENPDIFREKGLSRRPDRNQGVATEFAWRSVAFLWSSCWRVCALTTLSLRFHGAHNACTALSRRSHCAVGEVKAFFFTTGRSLCQLYQKDPNIAIISHLRHETMKVAMLKPSSFLQPWPDPKHSSPLGPPPSLSSKNDVNNICSILELLDLHIGK